MMALPPRHKTGLALQVEDRTKPGEWETWIVYGPNELERVTRRADHLHGKCFAARVVDTEAQEVVYEATDESAAAYREAEAQVLAQLVSASVGEPCVFCDDPDCVSGECLL